MASSARFKSLSLARGLRSLVQTQGYAILGTIAAMAGLAVLAAVATLILLASGGDSWPAAVSAAAAVSCTIAYVLLLWRSATDAERSRQEAQEARAAGARLHALHERVMEAVDALPVGFALYDREHRLVLFNRTYNAMIRHIGGLNQDMIGWEYEQVLTHLEAQMRVVFPERDLSGWKDGYLRRFRQREESDLQWENGQTMRLGQIQTASGGTVLLRMDVSDLKRSEAEARQAQKRFDLLVNSLSDAVFSTDRTGRFNYMSVAMAQMLGYRPEELLGLRPHEIIHPDDHAGLDATIRQMRSNRGTPVAFSHRSLHKDGSMRQMDVRMTAPLRSDNLEGELAVTGVMRDVQAQYEMAQRLRYELQRLDSIVQSSGASIVLVDRDLRIIMANNGFINSAPGRTAEGVFGRPLREVVKSAVDLSTFEAWFAAPAGDAISAHEYETSSIDAHGRKHYHHVTANPVRDELGLVQQIVFLAVDQTARREAEIQLFDSSRLATVGEMASGVAHEINQPLTIIRFAAESLQEQLQDTPPQAPLAESTGLIDTKLARIVKQTERAATIIQELKGFARCPEGAPHPFDIRQTIRAAAQLLQEQLTTVGIEQHLDLDERCTAVMGHGNRLQQVIINILLNARDAILEREQLSPPEPGPRGRIWMRVAHAPGGKIIAVFEDDGPGLPDAVLPRLFEPFFTTKPTGKGTGLGLSVSYQIIRQMGGAITAENRAEGGARFTITLDEAPSAPQVAAA